MSDAQFGICEQVLGAAANGLYQGMLVAAVAGLALRSRGRTNAATRHAVWLGVLFLVAGLVPAHLLLSALKGSGLAAAATPPASAVPVVSAWRSPVENTLAPTGAGADLVETPPAKEPEASEVSGYPASAELHDELTPRRTDLESRAAAEPKRRPSVFSPAKLKSLLSRPEAPIRLPHWMTLGLLGAWILLASARGAMVLWRIREIRRTKARSTTPGPGLQELFDRIREAGRTRRDVRLRLSSEHRTAVVLGFQNPVVLLPAETDQNANEPEVERVLRHELAHVERRDDWAHLIQQVVAAALFFHPAIWWISKRLCLEREIACDDHVLEAGEQPRAYALTLANMASRMNQRRHLLAPGVSNNKSQLQERITMILNTQRNRSPCLVKTWAGVFTTATALLAVLALNAGPRLAVAQSPSLKTAPSAPAYPALPPAPATEVAPAALPGGVGAAESGPRPKPGSSDEAPAGSASSAENAPTPAAVPTPPSPPVTALPSPALSLSVAPAIGPIAPMVAISFGPDAAPVSVATPEPPGYSASEAPSAPRPMKRHMSVEERLDRIERILEGLQARGELKGRPGMMGNLGGNQNQFQPGQPRPKGLPDEASADHAERAAAEQAEKEAWEAQRANEKAREQAMRSLQDGKRTLEAGQRKFEKAARDFDEKTRDLEIMRELQSDGPVKEVQALRDARAALQEQLRAIERQIKLLEEDRNKMRRDKESGETPDKEGADKRP